MHSTGKTVNDLKATFEALSSSANQVSRRASKRFFSDPNMLEAKAETPTSPTLTLTRGGAYSMDRLAEVKEEKALSSSANGGAAKETREETREEKIQRLTPYPPGMSIPVWTDEDLRECGYGHILDNSTPEELAQEMEEPLSRTWGVKPSARRSMIIRPEETLEQSNHGLGLTLDGLFNKAAAGLIIAGTGEDNNKNEPDADADADAEQNNDSWVPYGGGTRKFGAYGGESRRYGYGGSPHPQRQEVPTAGSNHRGLGSGAAVISTPFITNDNDNSDPFLEPKHKADFTDGDILTQIDSLLEDQYRAQVSPHVYVTAAELTSLQAESLNCATSVSSNARRQSQTTPQSVRTCTVIFIL